MEWNVDEVFKIIALYEQFKCLWDYKSSEYKRIDMKKNALEEIAKAMAKDIEDVKKKIKHLRSAYVAEKKKVDQSKKSGSETEQIYIPHLFYYNEMKFLDSVVMLRKTKNNLNTSVEEATIELNPDEFLLNDSQESEIEFSAQTPKTGSVQTGATHKTERNIKKVKLERENKFNYALDCIITNAQKVEDGDTMFTAFGKSVALQLAELPKQVAIEAMAQIQHLLASKITQSPRDIMEMAAYDADIY